MSGTKRRLLSLFLVAALPLLAHCDGESGDEDAGPGETDAGQMEVDAGPGETDAGPGETDAGPGETDAGPGETDAGPPPPALTSIALDFARATIAVDGTVSLTVTGTYDDASTETLTTGVTFGSSDESSATVDAAGVVTGIAAGAATITATADTITAELAVTVVTSDALVFNDEYGAGVSFRPFGGSVNDVTVSTDDAYEGASSLRMVVPSGGYTGGAFAVAPDATRDLSSFNALSFYVRADSEHTLNAAGLGNDAAGSPFNTEIAGGVALTTTWTEVIIPLPDPAKAGFATGLFHFAEGSDEGAYTVYFDDIRYVTLAEGRVTATNPAIATETITLSVGGTHDVNGTSVSYTIDGDTVTLAPTARAFFDFSSDRTDIASVSSIGRATAVAEGTAVITGTLASNAAAGATTIEVTAASLGPDTAAPAQPARDAGDVIALFSGDYTEEPVDTFLTPWSGPGDAGTTLVVRTEEDVGDPADLAMKYAGMIFVGINFEGVNALDIRTMTHLHVDVWVEGASIAGQVFRIKLVDFGAGGTFDPSGDNTEGELTWTPSDGERTLTTGAWMSLDIPIADFQDSTLVTSSTLTTTPEFLSQLIFVSEAGAGVPTNVWIDNLYFYNDGM